MASIADRVVSGKDVDPDTLYPAKTADIMRRYLALLGDKRKYKNIIERGIFRSRAAALVQLLAKPEKMLALDRSEERIEILDRFAELRALKAVFHAEYGVNQSNQSYIVEDYASIEIATLNGLDRTDGGNGAAQRLSFSLHDGQIVSDFSCAGGIK